MKATNSTYSNYPFGMMLPGRSFSDDSYRYGFQGQEKDDEIKEGEGTSLNYKYRMHDPRIGRFFAVDPLAAKYPHNSPYAFSENRVIDAIELEGLETFRISSDNYGRLHLNLINISTDFEVQYLNEQGELEIHKNFVFSDFQQKMKGPNGEPFNPENQVDKVLGVIYAPMVRPKEFSSADGETPDFNITTSNTGLVRKVPIGTPSFVAYSFDTEKDAFDLNPIEIDNTVDGVTIPKKLPDNYDYVDVFIQGKYDQADVLVELENHGVDIRSKEINFVVTPSDPSVDLNQTDIINVTFGTYE